MIKEKEELLKKINNKEVSNYLVENTYKQKYEALKIIVDNFEKVKNDTKNKEEIAINSYKNEISRLKNEINKCYVNDKKNIEKCGEIENRCKNMMENIKIKEDNYKKEIIELKNVIEQLKKEKNNSRENETNSEIIRQNKELIQKNNNLANTIIQLRNNIKNIENNEGICCCSCVYDDKQCLNCYNNVECIIYDICCDCHCINGIKCNLKEKESIINGKTNEKFLYK